ncbi:MAG: hypothetical protein R6X33_02870 [Candidatus Brocadiia bacterium]
MLSLESCDAVRDGLGLTLGSRVDGLRRSVAPGKGSPADAEELAEVSRDFASVLYTTLVQQMQRTVGRDEEQSVVSEGVRDFFGMFMPRALAEAQGDPLTGYLQEALSTRYGERLDETG